MRNALYFNKEKYEPNDIVNNALFDLNEYDDTLQPSTILTCIPNRIYDATITTTHGGIVVFTDAGLQKGKEKSNISMAATDSCGHLLHVFGIPIQFVGKPIIAETLAIQRL
ncbi:hypothetical protein HAX54_033688 [Datura stramonium]|uniref:Uncharacterized protein n=1 Tax=Datura stramonium TaxID=4076 RepID=A0ABS8SDM1_DATST|nr:hypothetical protein [Datura stramonium]